MKDWFEDFSKQYFEEEYDRYYLYNHNKELRAYKNIKITEIDGNIIRGYINYGKFKTNKIKIEFKEFTDEEKNKLLKIINDNPINIFKLCSKTVPAELFDAGIDIFPESLDDLTIECSFDDEYENLIDVLSILKEFNRRLIKNNFLIFKVKGLDLSRKIDYPVKRIDEIFNLTFKADGNDKTLFNMHDTNTVLLQNMEYPTKSFTFIYDDLFELLNEEISFLPKGFSSHNPYLNIDTNTKENIKSKSSNEYFCNKWNIEDKITIDIDDDYNITNTDQFSDENKIFSFLNEMNQTDMEDIDERVQFLRELLKLTYTLVNHYAIMPQIFKTDKSFQIRWIPSFFNSHVINYCKNYYELCPDDLVTFNGESLSKENQVVIIISLLMNALIRYSIEKNEIKYFDRITSIVFKLFTGEKILKDTKKSIENISRQLSVFYLNELDFTYVMFMDDNYDIEIKIRKDNTLKSIKEASEIELKNIKRVYDLFTYFKIENVIYEKISLNNHDFKIFNNNVKDLLKYVNVELNMPFEVIRSKMDLVLDVDLNKKNFRLDKIKNHYDWHIELDDTILSLKKFDNITNKMDEVIKIDNKVYIVDGYSFRHLKGSLFLFNYKRRSNEILQCAILGEYYDFKFKLSDNFRSLIKTSNVYDVPLSLTDILRPYQKIGFSWLIQNIKVGFGSILADDMGLGKTLQVLASILYFKENYSGDLSPSLIVVPPTLLSNWQQEIKKFTPELSYYIYHGSNRIYPTKHYDIILTSYGVIRHDLEQFLEDTWFIFVIDEAQNIKNPGTKQTRAIKEIEAFNKIALTGTPIENRLSDYWSIFDFVNEGYLSTLEDFKSKYIVPIQKLDDKKVLNNLRTIAKPFVLRRLKTDENIRKELPEKFTNDIYCSLTKKQIKLYNKLLDGIFEDIRDMKGIERKANILKLITALKQTCNHPGNYTNAKELKINESGKMELLTDILENILDIDEKVIIFTQYVKMGEIIQKLMSEKLKCEILFLHGKLSQKEKTKVINSFQEEEDNKILVATLKTGGVGLNLTAAQNVIHYDLWWNPAVENQATDRVHRIGQENDVMVYRFITKGTLEEKIDEMIKNKIDLAEKSISTDETFITELSNEKLKRILKLRL